MKLRVMCFLISLKDYTVFSFINFLLQAHSKSIHIEEAISHLEKCNHNKLISESTKVTNSIMMA